eukprot:4279200-Pyramimonas_sp.AAC.1
MDFTLLAGTQNVCRESEQVLQRKVEGRVVLEAAVASGLYTHRSAGVSILLGREFRGHHVRRVFSSPPELWGRCLAARIRRNIVDVCVGVLYYPPQPRGKGAGPKYTQTVARMTQRWRECPDQLPSRCLLIFFADLNDELGSRRVEG